MKTFSHYKPSFFKKSLITMMSLLYITTVRVTAQTPLVGSLGGSVEVAANGMATYSIPIEVVPGIKGVQPALSVVYSSAGGRGLLGSCWDLNGLSSVTRTPRTHFYDSDAGSVNFDSSDRYALDGARLIRLSDNGAYAVTNAVYGKEVEDFTRVTLKGTPDSPSQWFSAVTADGTVIEYGNTGDSKQTLGSDILSWWVSRVTDPDNNCMKMEYTVSEGEIVPYKIRYTENDGAGISRFAKVVFSYTADPHPNKIWIGGRYMTSSKLLSGIDVYYNSTLVRSYAFEYTHDRSTRLTAVVLKDGSGAELTRTSIAWGADGTAASGCNLWGMSNRHVCAGQFNSDNKADLLLYHYDSNQDRTFWSVMKGDGNGGFSSSQWSGYVSGEVFFSALDTDRNGIDEAGFVCPDSNGTTLKYKVLRFTGSGTTVQELASHTCQRIIPCDFLGTGGTQFLFVSAPQGQYRTIANSANNATLQVPSQAILSVTDLNGNGKADLQTVFGNGIDVYEYDAVSGVFQDILSASTIQLRVPDAEWFGDVNGDGCMDYVYFSNDSVFLRVSKGNDYAASQALPLAGNIDNDGRPVRPLMVGDGNGDGKDDIIQNSSGGDFVACMSRGTPGGTYSCDIQNYTGPGSLVNGEHEYVFEDFNGDGKNELIHKRSLSTVPFMLSFPERRGHDLVSAFTDGFGKTVSLRYGYYNTPNMQYLGTDGRRVHWPLAVRVAQPDGVGGSSVTWHTYDDAVYDHARKQTLGFNQYLAYRDGMNAQVTFLYDENRHRLVPGQSLDYYWERDTSDMTGYVPGGDFWNPERVAFYHHETFNTPAALPLAYGRFVPYNTVSSDINRLENTKTQTRTWLRADGLVERVSTAYSGAETQNGVNAPWVERDSAVYSYTAVTVPNGSQVMKLSGEVARHRRHGYSQTPAVTTLYSYSSAGRLDSVSVADLDGRVGATAYTYNACGLPLTVTYTPAGMAPLVTSFEYDPNGRFVTRETDPLGHSRSMARNLYTCLVASETGIDGLTTSYRYDALGRVTRVTRPDGTSRSTAYEWNTDTEYPDAVWRIRETETGTPETVEWRDILGRTVHSHTAGQGYHDVVYDALGRVVKSTFIPYATPSVTNPGKTWRLASYDRYGRVVWEKDPYTRLAYSYYDPDLNPNSDYFVTVTDSVRNTQRTRRYDALGRLKRAEDAGGAVEYAYGYTTRNGHIRDSLAVTTGNAVTVVLSDTRGNRLSIQDPDAGTVSSSYDAMNRLDSRTDANGNTTAYTYDLLGRVLTQTLSDGLSTETVAYTYSDTPGASLGKLSTVSHNGQTERSYQYDNLGRVSVMDVIDGYTHYTHQYAYDNLGRLQYLTYPSGYRTRHLYNSYGELSSVVNADDRTLVYSVETRNMFRQPLKCRFGNGTGAQYTYNTHGMVTGVNNGDVTDTSNTDVLVPDPAEESVYSIGTQYRRLAYAYNSRGFIESRSEFNALQSESYAYDNLDRLVSHTVNGTGVNSVTYDGTGNIASSTAAGSYTYVGSRPHAVTQVRGGDGTPIPSSTCDVAYGLRNLPVSVSENGYRLTLDYDAEGMRRHTRFYQGNTLQKTVTRVSGLHEVVTAGSVTRQLDYIRAGGDVMAILMRNGSADSLYYVLTDHLGSWEKVMDENKNTGHEHYDRFKIVNANARLYDPVIGRFFSPDPFVQVPDERINHSTPDNNDKHNNDIEIPSQLLTMANLYTTIESISFYNTYLRTWGDNLIENGINPGLLEYQPFK